MKLTLLAIALALPCVAQASYSFKIPLEMAQGGALENGSIIFNKPITTPTNPNPVEPAEPTEPDPFEIEDSRCDPYANTYPENYYGRQLNNPSSVAEVDENGNLVRYSYDCKLKNEDENVIAKYTDVINVNYIENGALVKKNTCDGRTIASNTNEPKTCEALGNSSYFSYKINTDSNGNLINYTYNKASLFMPPTADPANRYFIKGIECLNIRQKKNFFGIVLTGHYDCDLVTPITIDEIVRDLGKRYIIEIRKS